jgi:hypothetical protein
MKIGLCTIAGLAAALTAGAVAWAEDKPAVPTLTPGDWSISATMNAAGADAPKPAATQARRCLPPDVAAQGVAALLAATRPGCKAERSNVADGKIDVLMHCDQGAPNATTVTITGSFTPKHYEAASTITQDSGGKTMSRTATGTWLAASCSE